MPSSTRPGRGFVLPTTLLVTTLLTVMLTAAFILVSAEYRTTDNSLATTRALTIAQAGLQSYFAQNRQLTDTSWYDSTRYTLSGGYADVVARKLRASTTTTLALWVVRSSGYSTDPFQPGQAQGKRVVAQLAQLNLGLLPARAAMVAANGVQMIASGANPINGDDLGSIWPCVPPSGDAADTFGLSTPTGEYGGSSGATPGGEGPGGINYLASAGAVIDSTRIDWASLLGGNFVPDMYIYPTSPVSAWPPIGNSNYPVIYAPDQAAITMPPGTASNLRRGMLVARGNVNLGSTHWDGIIIAGGKINGGGTQDYRVHGMIISGLNISQGDAVQPNDIRRGGNRSIRWTWCYTRSATNSLSSLVPLRNGWIDTWTTY
jgi:Tfp pilus assembly protein PilV